MNERKDGGFVAYEYKTISVNRDLEPLYEDSYRSFGWIPVENRDKIVGLTDMFLPGDADVELKFKRDRSIRYKAEVDTLQRKCEAALDGIRSLERSKASYSIAASLSVGLVGLAALALSVFGLTFWNSVAMCIIFGIIGFAVCGIGFYLNGSVRKKRTVQVTPLIEEQYRIVYSTCEQASELLA